MVQDLVSRVLTTNSDFSAMAMLRHDVYCLEKGWVKQKRCGLEIDQYDNGSTIYFGVFYRSSLVGCQRLNPRPSIWMVDPGREYDDIGSTITNLKYSPDAAEASRLAISREFRSKLLKLDGKFYVAVILVLFRETLVYCRKNGIRYVYGGSYIEYVDHYRSFAPFVRISETRKMKDGLVEVAVLDVAEFEKTMATEMASFFTSKNRF